MSGATDAIPAGAAAGLVVGLSRSGGRNGVDRLVAAGNGANERERVWDIAGVSAGGRIKYDIVACGFLLLGSPFCSKNSIPCGETPLEKTSSVIRPAMFSELVTTWIADTLTKKHHRSFRPAAFFTSGSEQNVAMTAKNVTVLHTGATLKARFKYIKFFSYKFISFSQLSICIGT